MVIFFEDRRLRSEIVMMRGKQRLDSRSFCVFKNGILLSIT